MEQKTKQTKNESEIIYLEILHKFCSDDNMRPWMTKPFQAYGKTMATNGYTLVVTPKTSEYQDVDIADKIRAVYPVHQNMKKIYDVESIVNALAKCPIIDEYDSVVSICNACDGEGEVDFEFYHNGRTYETQADCPICDGSGEITTFSKVPNGKKKFDKTKLIKLNDCRFSPLRIEEIVFVANKLNRKTITLIHNTGTFSCCLFKIGDVELLVMPTNISTDECVIENIG